MWECWDLELEGTSRHSGDFLSALPSPTGVLSPERGSVPLLVVPPPPPLLLLPPVPPLPHPFPVPGPVEGGWRMSELVPPHSLRP